MLYFTTGNRWAVVSGRLPFTGHSPPATVHLFEQQPSTASMHPTTVQLQPDIMNGKKYRGFLGMRGIIAFLLTAACLLGQARLKRAEDLYDKTDYRASLALLGELSSPDADA